MKKPLIPLLSIFLFSTTAVFGEIPLSNVNKVKQLNWSEIIDAVSQTYQFEMIANNQVNQDGSNFYYPANTKYGKLSENGIGEYYYKEPKFDKYAAFYGDWDEVWSVDKQNDKICYGKAGDSINKHECVYLFEGFEMGIKYLYFSGTKNGNFYARTNQIIPIGSEKVFKQWSLKSERVSKKNIINVQAYALREKEEEERKKKEEERVTAAINKEERSIENFTKNLKILSQKLKDLEFDSLKVEVDELISEIEANTSSDLSVLKGLNKTLREMNSSVELKIKTEESKQRILSLKDYPGFRDLKPGLHYEDLTQFCPLRKNAWVKCYGIDNIKFSGIYQSNVLKQLTLDMGPIVNTEGFLSVFGENDSNIFIKMKKTMDKNYSRDYGYSERDRQLFNESEKSRLYEVYSGGKVVLEISRKEKDWSSDLWLYIHYFESSKAERFLKENRPVRASEDDF